MSAFSGKEVIKAGDMLLSSDIYSDDERFNWAMNVLSYWRSSHEQPLEAALSLVEKIAKEIDSNAIFAKRLKRLPSIVGKLSRFSEAGMKLKNMQDIGGCRVIVSTPKQLKILVKELRKHSFFKKNDGSVRFKDYIEHPKEDGYRSYHLIGSFNNKNADANRQIEVQLRTKIQHLWATTLEIVELYTGEALKTNNGSDKWHDFFKLVSRQLEFMEKLNKTKKFTFERDYETYLSKLGNDFNLAYDTIQINLLAKELKVQELLQAYTASIKISEDVLPHENYSGYLLLTLDINEKKVTFDHFSPHEGFEAEKAYTVNEKKYSDSRDVVIALIHARGINQIREAYPNYFADSKEFLDNLTVIIAAGKQLELIADKAKFEFRTKQRLMQTY